MSSTLLCQDMDRDTKEHQDAWRRAVIVVIVGWGETTNNLINSWELVK